MAVEELRIRWLKEGTLGTGPFIRRYLLEHGEAYIFDMYQILKALKEDLNLKVGSYQNFRNYIWWLRKLGLIELSRTAPSEIPFFEDRRYYRLTVKGRTLGPGKTEWRNPRRALYPGSWGK